MLESFCRFCLQPPNGSETPFTEQHADQYLRCSGFCALPTDGPKMICSSCNLLLGSFCQFKTRAVDVEKAVLKAKVLEEIREVERQSPVVVLSDFLDKKALNIGVVLDQLSLSLNDVEEDENEEMDTTVLTEMNESTLLRALIPDVKLEFDDGAACISLPQDIDIQLKEKSMQAVTSSVVASESLKSSGIGSSVEHSLTDPEIDSTDTEMTLDQTEVKLTNQSSDQSPNVGTIEKSNEADTKKPTLPARKIFKLLDKRPCTQCGKLIKDMKLHIQRMHTAPSLFCQHCGRGYTDKKDLRDHIVEKHTPVESWAISCSSCEKKVKFMFFFYSF